jgi:hypothetical protein
MRPRAIRAAGWLGGYLACLALWLSYARYGFNPWDECVLAHGALRVMDGQMVLVDFFGYAPGRYLYAALLFQLFGVSLLALRVGFCALTAGMPLLAYAIGRRLMPRSWALVPALLVALGPSVYYFRSYPLVALLGGWSLCRLLEAPSAGRQAAHGAVLMACALLESTGGGFVLLLTPLAVWATPAPWLNGGRAKAAALGRIFGAAALAALPVLGLYAWRGKLWEALSVQSYRYVVGSTSMWVEYPRPWSALFSGRFHETLQDSLFWAMALALAATVVYAALGLRRGRRILAPAGASPAAEPQLLVLCLLGILNFLLPVYRAGFYNVLRASPLPWLLGMFLASRLAGAGGREARGRRRLLGVPALIYAALYVLHLTLFPEYRNISTGGPPGAALNAGLLRLEDERAGILVEPRHSELIQTAKTWIGRSTREGDPIFAVPLNPLFYFFGRRPNPTGHDYILPGYWRDASQIVETVAALEKRPPKLFLHCDLPVDNRSERRFAQTSAPLYDYFLRRYAWTERHRYPLGPGLEVWFSLFRRLRPELHWPAPEAASRAPVPAGTRGPVQIGPIQIAGRKWSGWRLGPGGAVEVVASGVEPQAFLFRPRCTPDGPAWNLPQLRATVRRAGGHVREALRLGADAEDEGSLPAMAAIFVDPRAGEMLRLEVSATRPEHLRAEWQLLEPCLLAEAEAFYGLDETPRASGVPGM